MLMEDPIFPRMLLEGVHGKAGEPLVVTHRSRERQLFPNIILQGSREIIP